MTHSSQSPALTFWRRLLRALEEGHAVFLGLVVDHTRHSPGTRGARLFLAADETRHGTLGGGVMESRILKRATTRLKRRGPWATLETLVHRKTAPQSPNDSSASPSGMICAGEQTNLYYLCRPSEDRPAIAHLVDLLAEDRPSHLRISPSSLEVEESAPRFDLPTHRLEQEGEEWFYEEDLLERRRLAILGGGHCALALARTMTNLGYVVTAFESQKKVPEEGLDTAVRHLEIVSRFQEAGHQIPYPEITQVVVMTSDLQSDVAALIGTLGRPFPFLGVMGSPSKLAEIRCRLHREGFTHEDLDHLTAPVGLPIGSRTPEEIAISIAAQILSLRQEAP